MTLINRSAADKKVKVTNLDNRNGYLFEKLVAGVGVELQVVTNVDGVQTLVVNAVDPNISGLHQIRLEKKNGCVRVRQVKLLVDQTCSYMRQVAC